MNLQYLTGRGSDRSGCSVTTLTPASSDPGFWCSCRPFTCSVMTPPLAALGCGSIKTAVCSTSTSKGGIGEGAGVVFTEVPASLSNISSPVISPSVASSSSRSQAMARRISGAKSCSVRRPCYKMEKIFVKKGFIKTPHNNVFHMNQKE